MDTFCLYPLCKQRTETAHRTFVPCAVCFSIITLGQIPPPEAVRLGTLERQTRPFFQRKKRFNSVQPVCELLPQTLSLHVVDVLIAVGGVNDLNTGVDEGVNRLALEALNGCFYCLVAHVVAELGDIHAERTVLDGGDSGGIAVKAAHNGIGIRLLSINAEKLHFCNKKCSFHGGDREI